MTPPLNPDPRREFALECRNLLVQVAVEASEAMPIEKRIMIHRGAAALFAKDSPEFTEASQTAAALSLAETHQMELIRLLKHP